MASQTAFDFPLVLNVNGSAVPYVAESVNSFPEATINTNAAVILTENEGNQPPGLYVWDGMRWRLALEKTPLSSCIIKGYDISLYYTLTQDITISGNVAIYRNSVFIAGNTITQGTAVYAVVFLGSGASAGVNTVNGLSGDVSILQGDRIQVTTTGSGVTIALQTNATDEGTYT